MFDTKSGSPQIDDVFGELRRFEFLTDDADEIAELKRVVVEKKLTRQDLGIILLYLGVRPGIGREAFGIQKRSGRECPSIQG